MQRFKDRIEPKLQTANPCAFLGYIPGERILVITLTERLPSCTFGPGDFQTMKWLEYTRSCAYSVNKTGIN